ncbi:hypothetical protein D3C72_2371360 [compost metagenome]
MLAAQNVSHARMALPDTWVGTKLPSMMARSCARGVALAPCRARDTESRRLRSNSRMVASSRPSLSPK